MDSRSLIDRMVEKTGEMVRQLRECGVTDELVLVVPLGIYLNYSPTTWGEVKERAGVDHVERSEIGFPNDVEAMVVQRSEYLRMFIKSLGEKGSD